MYETVVLDTSYKLRLKGRRTTEKRVTYLVSQSWNLDFTNHEHA